jgi:hypothetical protein
MTGMLHSRGARHEHIVRINDVTIPMSAWLTREQLWIGLAATMREPGTHDESIDACTIISRTADALELRIARGHATVLQTITHRPPNAIRVDSQCEASGESATLEILIEEPAPGALFVRFAFELPDSASEDSAEEGNARRAAYEAYARDIVRSARRLASGVVTLGRTSVSGRH